MSRDNCLLYHFKTNVYVHVYKKNKKENQKTNLQSFVVAIQYNKYIKVKYDMEQFFLNNGYINKINAVWAVWEK